MPVFTVSQPTPVLNTPYFSRVYGALFPFDHKGLVREVEMVALPDMVFQVTQEYPDHIIEVVADVYPTKRALYLDRRYGKVGLRGCLQSHSNVEKDSFSLGKYSRSTQILSKFAWGFPIFFLGGGNYHLGIPDWEKYYPPPKVSGKELAHWNLKGVDCSGLLFEACRGLTPRNTSELLSYGQEVSTDMVQPLDLILFPGHVIIALNEQEVIESCLELGGVVKNSLSLRLSQIREEITVRRFHPDAL